MPLLPDAHKQCVLFVDDEKAVLDGLRRTLHQASFEQLFAQSAFHALKILDSCQVDIIVADEHMPGMSGSELLTIVRNQRPDIIRIILSGHASLDRLINAINAGQIHHFLAKPMDSKQILGVLNHYLSELRLKATQRALHNRTDIIGRWEWDILTETWQGSDGIESILHCQAENRKMEELFATVHPEDREELLHALRHCKECEQAREVQHRLLLPDGSVRWVAQYMDVFRDGENIWRIIGMVQDITAHKERDELLAERVQLLQKTLDKTVEALARVTEIRDPYTAGHQERVAGLALKIGGHMGLDPARLSGLEIAGKLHDIGKIYAPSELLSRPGALRDAEMSLLKLHSEIGFQIVQDIPFGQPVAQIILQHHERLDGSGYPHGLRGEEILLEARIIAAADVFEAMSSFRPYRPGLGQDVALAELVRNKGKAFDPDVVEALEELIRRGDKVLEDLSKR